MLFTEVLSAVTAHVLDKRSTWGIALENADLTDLDRRAIADVRLVPVAAPAHALALRARPIDTAGLADAVQIVLGEHRHEAERAAAQKLWSHLTEMAASSCEHETVPEQLFVVGYCLGASLDAQSQELQLAGSATHFDSL